ncbi:MAG: PaaI family thioesterase [Chloroflexota bacterium]|nr:PaaI family thioesterase [Chloroflexota bacterium]
MTASEPFSYNDPFAHYLGIEKLEISEGKARARLSIQKHHLNSHGTLHGGTIFALADVVLGAASNSHGQTAVAIHATISYIKAISSGVMIAETEEISRNAVLGLYNVRVIDDAGDLVAVLQGTVYLKRSRVDILS